MASPPSNSTAEELEDELIIQQTMLESLADTPDDDPAKHEIRTTIESLERRLRALNLQYAHSDSKSQSHSGASESEVVDSNDSDDTLSIGGDFSSKRAASFSPHEAREAKRRAHHIPSPHARRASATVRKYLSSSALERQRKAEEDARRRHREEEADAAFAMQLSQQGGESSSVAASRFQHDPTYASSTRIVPVKTEPHRPDQQTSRTLPWTQENAGRSTSIKRETVHQSSHDWGSGVVDLTLDSDGSGEDTGHRQPTGLSIGRYARTPQELVHAVHDPRQMPSSRDTMSRLMFAQNYPAQREQERRAQQEQDRRRADLEAAQHTQALQRQREQIAYRTSHGLQDGTSVYQMPGTFPGSSSMPMPSIYERQPTHSATTYSAFGRSLSSYHEELSRLGNLISTGEPVKKIPYGGIWDEDDESFNDEQTLDALKDLMDNIRPDEEIPIDERDVEVESMTVKLKPYQAAGLKWLQNQEEGTNKGSILADDMGLGKTIQAIALMSTRPSEEHLRKTNLIVAPVALLRQWKDEITTRLKRGRHAMSVFIHHGPQKKKSWEELRTFDVVITTFGTIASEMRKRDIFLARQKIDRDTRERPNEKCLFIGDRPDWYRVIIDEAQNIKNRSTQSSRGACLIKAKYRLCMTGTPMMNSVDELHSLIRFLRIRPYNDWTRFSSEFSKPIKSSSDDRRASAMQKLQALLKAILLRRQKKSTINGKPILILPERVVEATHPEFSPEERDFYTALETQQRINFNKYVAAGTVGKSYAHILVMLLRLRQACCHPHLIKDFGVAIAADISQETMDDIARGLDAGVVERIKASNGEFECPVCYDAVQNPAIFVPCGHDTCADCYVKIKEAAQGGDNGQAKCPNCRGLIDPKKVLDWETFKKIHIPVPAEDAPLIEAIVEEALDDSATESDDDETESESGSETESETESLDGFIVDDKDEVDEAEDSDDVAESSSRKGKLAPQRAGTINFSDSDSDTISESGSSKSKGKQIMRTQPDSVTAAIGENDQGADGMAIGERMLGSDGKAKRKTKGRRKRRAKGKSKGKGKGKAKSSSEKDKKKKKIPQRTLAELKKLASRNKGAKRQYLRQLREGFEMSTKIQTTMNLLKQIINETDEKIIVFSQWTSLLDLLEIPIDEQGWGYHRYDGSMNARDRADAIDEFKSTTRRPQVRLMLVSLKAGNAGLNLTCASQVIILDPFWNPYIEEQAIDRAHRLGQERQVHVHRLLIENTVEDRIMALQEEKRAMINEALDEGAGQALSRLSVQQLGYLFGLQPNPSASRQPAITAGGSGRR
ncbi:P-loop containing nucleoside triphosphate hydrolase protein [Myriangium duriaei CBS 260.36]|uniref:P-loop containing nucleoside triphosphate hydrolase protein n=1 Tax=Myriangium duriaei CBS 260.36 TaxID=1168546 RepID=A0A9P4IXN6_9PEZI|nr:P-loop containing nucleoside triphosphate hydrolase protein [Myriangium duriaei CBS 260.36]